MKKKRILIVDDNLSFRKYVTNLLGSEPYLEIVGEAENGLKAMKMAGELHSDLVLMDIRLPGENGIQITKKLKSQIPDIKIIILTVFDMPEYREAALINGACCYFVKKSIFEELVPAIQNCFKK